MKTHFFNDHSPLARSLAVGLAASLALTGCPPEEDPGENGVAVDDVHELVVIDRDSGDTLGDYHDGDHWHGQIILDIEDEDPLSVGFEFYDEDEEEIDIPLGEDDFDYDIEIDDESLVTWETHSDHIHLYGDEAGDTEVWFEFTEDGDVFFDTSNDGFPIIVDDSHEHDEDLHVTHFGLLDRSDEENEFAYVHDNHWDGTTEIELEVADDPSDYETSAVGEHGVAVSLGAAVSYEHDDHEDDLDWDSEPYELAVEATEHGEKVELDHHGDHVHIIGAEEGHAHVVFQVVDPSHGDEVLYETPDFEIDVHAHD